MCGVELATQRRLARARAFVFATLALVGAIQPAGAQAVGAWPERAIRIVLPFPPGGLVARIAPTGTLRAAINLGNAVLAGRDAATGAAKGVTVDLAGELAKRLGVGLELVVVDGAAKSVDAVVHERADVGFFAIDPQRGAEIAFTPPYVLIEGCYLVREASPLRANDEVDRAGHVVVVGQGSAYDLHLTRTLQHATIVRAATSQAVVQTFLERGADAAAGVRQQLEADAKRLGGVRLLEGRFMVIRQAMGIAKRRGDDAARWLAGFIEAMKAEGAVASALARHGIDGASVAPPEAAPASAS
jgi:polar amino acid transport system substrate-binding protein